MYAKTKDMIRFLWRFASINLTHYYSRVIIVDVRKNILIEVVILTPVSG